MKTVLFISGSRIKLLSLTETHSLMSPYRSSVTSVLLNNVQVGSGSVIGAGAVLMEGLRVPPGSLVLGIPAKVVRPVDDALKARIRLTTEHYVALARRHRRGEFPLRGR